jgi:hypothetical protein
MKAEYLDFGDQVEVASFYKRESGRVVDYSDEMNDEEISCFDIPKKWEKKRFKNGSREGIFLGFRYINDGILKVRNGSSVYYPRKRIKVALVAIKGMNPVYVNIGDIEEGWPL